MPRKTFTLTRGDTLPILVEELRDPKGRTPNLTGATVTLKYRIRDKSAPLEVRTMTVLNGPAACVRYAWTPSDAVTAGHYDGQIKATWPSGATMHFPNNEEYFDLWIAKDLT